MATPGNRDLTSAYADLVAGVLDARSDSATQAFDAEIAMAEAEGRIDARTARALRWWQRESLRALVEHSRTALPPALAALGQAQAEASRGTADAAESWARAVGDPALAPTVQAVQPVLERKAPLEADLRRPAPSMPAAQARPTHLPDTVLPTTAVPAAAGPTPTRAPLPNPALPVVSPRTDAERPLATPPDLRERRRRLIVAGLSPLPHEE